MHLRQKGEYCPVTGMPCQESRVMRLYEPTACGSSGGNKVGGVVGTHRRSAKKLQASYGVDG